MKVPKRRAAQGQYATDKPQQPRHPDEWLAILLSWIQTVVQPAAIHEMAYLDDGATATRAAGEVGRLDAQSRTADEVTREPRMPHQETVKKYVMELPEVVGKRAFEILAALKAGTLTVGFTPTSPAKGWKAMSLRTKILMVVAFALEFVFGAKMAERLAGAHDYISWAVGLAIALLLTFSSLAIAAAIHKHESGLLRGKGAWVALGVSAVAVGFLMVYSWGLGGGAKATTSGGGLSGGGVAGQILGGPGSTENWALTAIYAAMMLLMLTSVILSHLIDLYDEDVELVDRDMPKKQRVLTLTEQRALAIELLRQCLVLNQQSKHRARGLLMAYVGGVLSELSPAVNSAWSTADLENIDIPDPVWVPKIEAEIKRLTRESGHDDSDYPEPPQAKLISVK